MTGRPAASRSDFFSQLSPGMRTFAIVDAVLVATFVVLLVMQLAAGPTPSESASVTTPPTGEPETDPEPSSPADPEPSVPADPDQNEGLTEFVLPSSNIWCTMTDTSATCTIGAFTYDPPEEECDGVIGPVLTVVAGEPATMPCVEAKPARPDDAAVLDYGQASTIGEMTCHSTRNGATCRHDPTGEGFSVSYAGYTFF